MTQQHLEVTSAHRPAVRAKRARSARRTAGVLLTLLLGSPPWLAAAPPLPESGEDVHLGVVSCAGSTCHGASEPLKDSSVLQNEFITWNRQESHSKAYKVLLEKDGQRIARNLGLASAASADECLACHADLVPKDKRGKRHQMADGVGCEACHGGGERYLGPHVSGSNSHADNLAQGLYPTEEPVARAKLCLSCHLGAQNKFATHRIMGAGHPRISFELDTFTELQVHHRVDDDYRQRKQVYSGVQVWAIGQVLATREYLSLFENSKWKGEGLFPELSFFDCHACHHPMKEPRWNARATTGLGPGVIRLNDSNMLMLLHLARRMDGALAKDLHDGLLGLHRATTQGMDAARQAAKALGGVLDRIEARVLGAGFNAADMRAILTTLVEDGVAGEYNDYSGAEQAVMAMHSVIDTLKAAGDIDAARHAKLTETLKSLYAVLKDENAYRPEQLVASLRTLKSGLE